MTPLLIPVAVLSGIGLVMATMLAIGRRAFAVEVDERQEKLLEILPGANCGGCGYPGCSGYAAALIEGTAVPSACPPGGAEMAQEIGRILGVEVSAEAPKVALVACAGDNRLAPERARYLGVRNCSAAHNLAGGPKKCEHGCLGLGTCLDVCPFDAILITSTGLAQVIPERCTGCGACVSACPRGIIKMVPAKEQVHVLCVNPNKAKAVKEVCSVGCTGCKLCTKQSKRLSMNGSLAFVDSASDGEIPEPASWACPQGSIFDSRKYAMTTWLTDPTAREDHEKRAEEWKSAEKAKKAAAKKAKDAKKAAADEPSKKDDTPKGKKARDDVSEKDDEVASEVKGGEA